MDRRSFLKRAALSAGAAVPLTALVQRTAAQDQKPGVRRGHTAGYGPLFPTNDETIAKENAHLNTLAPFAVIGSSEMATRADGKLSVRSGTARIALVPDWEDDVPRKEHLPPFAGAQLQVIIPKRVQAP